MSSFLKRFQPGITGTWYHATFSGGKAMGTFNLTRRHGNVR
jgi:hypothetical protein